MGSHSYLVNLNSPIHFNQAIATAIEARADKADSLADARINTLARLTDAQKTKLIAATDAIDAKIHTFVDAHTDAALMNLQHRNHFASHFTKTQAAAIEARADKADQTTDARITANTKLSDAQKAKLIAAADALDARIHTFVDAHTDAALMEMPLSVHFTKAQAAAMEARADKVESTAEAKVNASTKLSDAQKAKLIAALKLEDSNLHKFVDAHTTAAQLQEMYCALTHLGDCFWA